MKNIDELIERKVDQPQTNITKPTNPNLEIEKVKAPQTNVEIKETPKAEVKDIDIPICYDIENTIFIKGKPYELKPTELLYFRNGMTDSFGYVRAIPINEIVKIPAGIIDKKYSGDELLFRFLYAAFNGDPVIKKHYNDITAGDVDKIINIFGRINGIFAREEEAARKKQEAQQTNP